jgi:formylglycine-generating enzyme required for sulfatase activity
MSLSLKNVHRTTCAVASALASLLALGCSSCSGDDGAGGDGGTDTGTEIDTSFDFGETTPCVNEAQPGEVCIPGGKYLMGCVPGDDECEDNEKPLVAVALSPFFVDREEATVKKLVEFLNDIKDDPGVVTYPYLAWTDGTNLYPIWGTTWSWGSGQNDYVAIVLKDENGDFYFNEAANEECPAQGGQNAAVGGFSWLGAKMYCEWKGMQLPTEAQWEAAARGQTFNEFPCGSDLPECWQGVYACCYEEQTCGWAYYDIFCHCCAPLDVDEAFTCDSPHGVKGMYGNSMEWTANYYSNNHSDCAAGCVDPQSATDPPFEGAGHIIKDGSIAALDQSWLRISIRWNGESDDGGNMTGVRCVRPDTPFVPPDAGIDAGK